MTAVDELTPAELSAHVDAGPTDVLAEAIRRQSTTVDHVDLAHLHLAVGLSRVALGDLEAARTSLQTAVDIALADGLVDLAARTRVSLSFVLGRLGALDDALAVLDASEAHLEDADLARLHKQRGLVLYWRGDFAAAASTLETACGELRRHGDRLGEVQARVNLGAVLGQIREYAAAEGHQRQAIEIGETLGADLLVATAQHNLGYLAMLRGDLPTAIEEFETAERGFVSVGAEAYLPRLHADHAQVLGEAALFDDASMLMRNALDMLERHGNEIEVAGALVTQSEIRLAQGDAAGARAAADEAAQWFTKHGRDGWVAISTSLALQAAARERVPPADLAAALTEVAERLDRDGLRAEAVRAHLVAAKVRVDNSHSFDDFLADPPVPLISPETRRAANRGRSTDQILLASVDAQLAARRNDRRGARRAVTRGLKVAMSAQAALGSIETRAHAAVHGYALTRLGARLAIEDGRPRELLERVEATRLLTSRLPSVRPDENSATAKLLVDLRRLDGAMVDPASTAGEREDAARARVVVERNVRRRSRARRGEPDTSVGLRHELSAALAQLDDRLLLAHADLDGTLYAVAVVDGRASLHQLGPVLDVKNRMEGVAFALNRLNRRQGSAPSRQAATEMLDALAAELASLLLPNLIAESAGPVVIVPTAALHDVPWALLPSLDGRPVSINPSVSAWARADRTRRERRSARTGPMRVGFMAGPGLEFADLEVSQLAAEYADPRVVVGRAATGAAFAELLGWADLVHIACHGSFRTDNPMFSSLHLADGPLIVHDLERLDRLPETVVLPACNVANTKALHGGSLLGLATALITLGAGNVIAPLTPINDASSVAVMFRLHRELLAGRSPAAALAAASSGSDVADPTAGAFIALGA